jgi:zinc transport system permease protein
LVFSIASAFGVGWLSRKGVREDSAIAAFWALGMALGVICIFRTPGYAPDISTYLFGNILTVTTLDLWLSGSFALVMTFAFLRFFKPILYTAFDREFARTKGLKVNLIETLMMLAIAVCIVSSIRLIGIMLLMSLLTIPQMTANLFTAPFGKMALYSVAISILGCFTGLFLSYSLNVPSGAAIIFVQVIFFLLCKTGVSLSRRGLRRTSRNL